MWVPRERDGAVLLAVAWAGPSGLGAGVVCTRGQLLMGPLLRTVSLQQPPVSEGP